MTETEDLFESVYAEASKVLIGNRDIVEGMTVALLTNGHVLLEGIPGVAKTTIATVFARTLGLDYTRIQMTPDLLPADIVGTSVYREATGEFAVRRGPIFSNIVLADEINRATAQTQSALLEAMQERRVTIDGETIPLPQPFILLATQNPLETQGTFALPAAQRDRFQLKLNVGIPDSDTGVQILERFDKSPDLDAEDVEQVVSLGSLEAAKDEVKAVYVDRKVKEFIQAIADASWNDGRLDNGASPRATLHMLYTSKAYAALEGREYVIPADVIEFGVPVLRHRLELSPDAKLDGFSIEEVVRDMIGEIDLPDVEPPSES